jgi:hypothetical protein
MTCHLTQIAQVDTPFAAAYHRRKVLCGNSFRPLLPTPRRLDKGAVRQGLKDAIFRESPAIRRDDNFLKDSAAAFLRRVEALRSKIEASHSFAAAHR